MSGFFTENAKEEQKLLRENFPKLYKRYDPYSGYICITDEDFKSSSLIRQEVREIIEVSTKNSRYVMYRSELPDENGELTKKGYVICQANIVE